LHSSPNPDVLKLSDKHEITLALLMWAQANNIANLTIAGALKTPVPLMGPK
jgi:hypothetical protein